MSTENFIPFKNDKKLNKDNSNSKRKKNLLILLAVALFSFFTGIGVTDNSSELKSKNAIIESKNHEIDKLLNKNKTLNKEISELDYALNPTNRKDIEEKLNNYVETQCKDLIENYKQLNQKLQKPDKFVSLVYSEEDIKNKISVCSEQQIQELRLKDVDELIKTTCEENYSSKPSRLEIESMYASSKKIYFDKVKPENEAVDLIENCINEKNKPVETIPTYPESNSSSNNTSSGSSGCHSAYSGCLKVTGDLDCKDIGEVVYVKVPGVDPYNLDSDDDGVGCESY